MPRRSRSTFSAEFCTDSLTFRISPLTASVDSSKCRRISATVPSSNLLSSSSVIDEILLWSRLCAASCRRQKPSTWTAIARSSARLIEQSDDDQDEDDHEQYVNQISRLWDTTAAPWSKESEKPHNQQNNDEYFEHITSRFNMGRAPSVPTETRQYLGRVNLNRRRSIQLHQSFGRNPGFVVTLSRLADTTAPENRRSK
jgi:hypothetical protein